MACKLILNTNNVFAPITHHFGIQSCFRSRCTTTKSKIQCSSTKTDRNFIGYKNTLWNTNLHESLKRDNPIYQEDDFANMLEKVKREVKHKMNDEGLEPLMVFKLVDEIQRLGLGKYFGEDTNRALRRFVYNFAELKLDLHATALGFRLFRQNKIFISQDIFKKFVDENGKFMSSLCSDNDGMISLYEASYLGFEGEHLLDEAKTFTKEHLPNHWKNKKLPLRYRLPVLEARHYVETHPKTEKILLELAMLDFNRTQLVYQQDIHEVARWWKDLALSDQLHFARERIMESFIWGIGITPKLEHSSTRKLMTKVSQLIATLDDIYDVYGTLDELELFTKAIERWDINTIDELPDYMKIAFFVLYNTVNETGYEIIKLTGCNSIPYLKKTWLDMCKAFLKNVKWCHNRQTPTFEEYLDNGWLSVSGIVFLAHAFFFVSPEITPEALLCLKNNHDLLRSSSIIFRICNDLGMSEMEIERGETCLQMCYAKQEGVPLEEACEHLSKLVDENWKRINETQIVNETPFSNEFVDTVINITHTAQCCYQHGDGFGSPELIKEKIESLVINPLQL